MQQHNGCRGSALGAAEAALPHGAEHAALRRQHLPHAASGIIAMTQMPRGMCCQTKSSGMQGRTESGTVPGATMPRVFA